MDIIRFVQSFSNPVLDKLFQYITMIGEDYFFIAIFAVIFWCIDRRFGYRLAFAYLTSGLVNGILKETFRIERPIGMEGIRSLRLETAGGYSFPSGHSQVTASLFTSLMLRVKSRAFSLLGGTAIFLVALSRVYLGVHTPMDVIFGVLIGILWVFAANRLFDWMERTSSVKATSVMILVSVAAVLLFPTATHAKVSGTIIGLLLGYILESRLVAYNPRASFPVHVIKVAVGIGGLLFLKVFVKQLLPELVVSDLVRYFLIGIWMVFGVPWLFTNIPGLKQASGTHPR